MIRLSGAGHSAAIHRHHPPTIPCLWHRREGIAGRRQRSLQHGSGWIRHHLARAFTIGTGYFGSSSVGEKVGPQHLINWTRIDYNDDPAEAFGDFSGLDAPSGGPALALGREAPISLGRLQEGAPQIGVPTRSNAAGGDDEFALMR
ncbi:hypothetical protein [Mesorhizobium sp. M0140]|uniref:hypothetical protein n=1 Tax=Mesorhizobium sp. M0140 TaxID=2956893 RepID=UPI003338BB99